MGLHLQLGWPPRRTTWLNECAEAIVAQCRRRLTTTTSRMHGCSESVLLLSQNAFIQNVPKAFDKKVAAPFFPSMETRNRFWGGASSSCLPFSNAVEKHKCNKVLPSFSPLRKKRQFCFLQVLAFVLTQIAIDRSYFQQI